VRRIIDLSGRNCGMLMPSMRCLAIVSSRAFALLIAAGCSSANPSLGGAAGNHAADASAGAAGTHPGDVSAGAGGNHPADASAGAGGNGVTPSSGGGGSAGVGAGGQGTDPSVAGAGHAGGVDSAAGSSGAAVGGGAGSAPDPALETIEVDGDGTAISKMSLDNGELFLLRANGVINVGGAAVDAEFGGFAPGKPGTDAIGEADVGIDFGLKTVRAAVPAVAGRMKWFGGYRDDHVYYVIVGGAGAPLSLKLVKPTSEPATGGIAISIYRLSPTPQPVGTLVDTVMASLTKAPVKSVIATRTGTTYLLQCMGQGPVGGGGLAAGDADWMDYTANGTGKLDIGDAKTDYGLGVDETFVGAANSNTPRKRWWGQWRQDHAYYMLFSGSGNPIEFQYYDVGYGDNSATVKLSVPIRELH
jgi:hypothetical protein